MVVGPAAPILLQPYHAYRLISVKEGGIWIAAFKFATVLAHVHIYIHDY